MHTETGEIKDESEITEEEKDKFVPVGRKLTLKEIADLKVQKYSPCGCGSGKKFKFCCYKKEK